MNSVENKNQIVDINGYVHVINGKVICFKSDVYDLNNSKDVKDLLSFVDGLSESDNLFSGQIDSNTVIDLKRNPKNNEVIVGFGGYLPCLVEHLDTDMKEKVMSAVEEYHSLQALYENNQIVDIGENVYVINKKPVYIYPGALDLHKAADVDEICRLVCDTGDDMAERLTRFGEDTMLVLGIEPEDGRYNISSGDIVTLPDDIQKKVRLFTK